MRRWSFIFFSTYLVISLAVFCGPSARAEEAFMTGWNQGWIEGKYGSQWVAGFNPAEFGRVLDLAKGSGAGRVRFWLFEGFNSDALLWENGRARGIHPDFVKNLRNVVAMAKERGLKLNLTLFDGNISHNTAPSIDYKNFFWDLFNDLHGERENFLNQVFQPLLKVLSEPNVHDVVDQLDLMNEIDSATWRNAEIRFLKGWKAADSLVREAFDFKKDSGLAPSTKFTASVGWSGAEKSILNQDLSPDSVDFYDLHVYSDDGTIPKADKLVAFAREHGKAIQLGEFGQKSAAKDDTLQSQVTRKFINNARKAGFSEAMAWRLKGDVDGERFLYQMGDTVRPAYSDFKDATFHPEGVGAEADCGSIWQRLKSVFPN